jgi:hypothetical protein
MYYGKLRNYHSTRDAQNPVGYVRFYSTECMSNKHISSKELYATPRYWSTGGQVV